jgi:hypothetical protein
VVTGHNDLVLVRLPTKPLAERLNFINGSKVGEITTMHKYVTGRKREVVVQTMSVGNDDDARVLRSQGRGRGLGRAD